jgi:hypothetical protein
MQLIPKLGVWLMTEYVEVRIRPSLLRDQAWPETLVMCWNLVNSLPVLKPVEDVPLASTTVRAVRGLAQFWLDRAAGLPKVIPRSRS